MKVKESHGPQYSEGEIKIYFVLVHHHNWVLEEFTFALEAVAILPIPFLTLLATVEDNLAGSTATEG
jgi:hypothetical protein